MLVSWDGDFKHHTQGQYFAALVDFVLNCACFIYIGAWLPFGSFYLPALGITPSRLVILSNAILFARRIPALLMLYKWIPEIRDWREALFTGHFGPMGVGAVFVSTLALHKLPSPKYPPETQQDYLALMLQPIVTFVVLSSIIIRLSFYPRSSHFSSFTLCRWPFHTTSQSRPIVEVVHVRQTATCQGRRHGSGQGHKA
jgi:NhaP-type Na+/H+ or K+/H+ antiporter